MRDRAMLAWQRLERVIERYPLRFEDERNPAVEHHRSPLARRRPQAAIRPNVVARCGRRAARTLVWPTTSGPRKNGDWTALRNARTVHLRWRF